MEKRIHITLIVKFDIDDEYPAEHHVEDILSIARRSLPVAQVDIVNFETGDLGDASRELTT